MNREKVLLKVKVPKYRFKLLLIHEADHGPGR